MDYVITVNDNGELKTITALELSRHNRQADLSMAELLNEVLEARSIDEALRAEQLKSYKEVIEGFVWRYLEGTASPARSR